MSGTLSRFGAEENRIYNFSLSLSSRSTTWRYRCRQKNNIRICMNVDWTYLAQGISHNYRTI
jgi:hypothetical protein